MVAQVGKWLKRINNRDGFTLVEVLTSFAVLAIISVALLQMFVVSTKTNGVAYKMDKANALCTDMAEKFKQDPNFVTLPANSFASTSSAISGGILYQKYYNNVWTECASSEAVYRLDLDVSTTSAIEMEESYHPAFAYTGTLTSGTPQYLDITSTGALQLGGSSLATGTGTIQYSAGTAIIPIGLDCKNVSTTAVTLNVNNRADPAGMGMLPAITNVIADIYLCDIPSGASINLAATTGYSNENRISTNKVSTSDYKGDIHIVQCSDNQILTGIIVLKRLSR